MAGRQSLPGELAARKRTALRLLSVRSEEVTIRDIAQEAGLDRRTVRQLAAQAETKKDGRG